MWLWGDAEWERRAPLALVIQWLTVMLHSDTADAETLVSPTSWDSQSVSRQPASQSVSRHPVSQSVIQSVSQSEPTAGCHSSLHSAADIFTQIIIIYILIKTMKDISMVMTACCDTEACCPSTDRRTDSQRWRQMGIGSLSGSLWHLYFNQRGGGGISSETTVHTGL